jgi:hypothetical protein
MAQTGTIGKTATHIYQSEGYQKIKYHNTDVVSFNDKEIILNTGGWRTKTTKLRMNQASNQFALGYTVYQKNGTWYVEHKGETIRFSEDTLRLER